MTIDEAINIAKSDIKYNKSIGCDTSYEEQLAEWLEELKSYRAHIFSGDMSQTMLKEVYNKAIEEAICKVEEHKTRGYVTGITNNPFEFGACQMADDIVKILKRLKAGEENDL